MVTNCRLNGVVIISSDQYIDALAELNLFKSYSREELKDKLNASGYEIRKYQRDQIVHLQNEICSFVDIILEGRVAIQKIDEEGNILTIDVFSRPEMIGTHLIFSTHNVYPMTVVAETDVVILRLGRELIIKLGQSSPDFMVALLQIISDRIIILAEKIRAISHKTIRQRIIDFLTYEYHIQQSEIIKLNYSKKELAERLGIQRTSLSRELNKMRKDGFLDYNARTITLKKSELIHK